MGLVKKANILCTDKLRFAGYYVRGTKCLPDKNHKKSPNKTVLIKVLKLMGIHYDIL